MTLTNAAIDAQVRLAQLHAHARTDRDARWMETALVAALAAFYAWQLHTPVPLLWLALRAVAHGVGHRVAQAYRADPERDAHAAHWQRALTSTTAMDSMLWALAAWLVPPPGNLLLFGLLALIIGVASSVAVYATQLESILLAWTLPMNLGIIGALAWQGQPLFWFLAACLGFNLGLVLHFGRLQQALLRQALRVHFEKEALAEQLAEQVRIAQQANAEKTRFLTAASHDLRQPMHAIALFGAVLEQELQQHRLQRSATQLMQAVNALSQSLDAMLDISRLDAGAITPAIQATPLNTIFQSLNHTFAPAAEQRGLQLRLRASPLWLRTDPALLHRLLANLVDNALKYTQHGGVLLVARARGAVAWIDVRDTGIGIDAAHHPHLFQEFYQVDNPGRDRSRGLGIGLSIVQRLSQLLDHPVQLHSRPGRGSRFRVIVPIAAEPAPQPPPPQADARQPPALLPRRVLLVDDEGAIAQAMAALMHTHGVTLAHAVTAAQAREQLHAARATGQPFDALVCDLRLAEGADGLALALQLRQQQQPPLPTVIVSGETAPAALQRVQDKGLSLLHKPVAATTLLNTLARIASTGG